MVNFNALSKAMQTEITKAMAGDGADPNKIDSRNEYNQLSKLLSGASGADEKSYIENLMFKYEEEYEVSPGTRNDVAEIINRHDETVADLESEINDLKAYKKAHKKELSDADKKYIDDVIKGKAITLSATEEAEEKPEEEKSKEKPSTPPVKTPKPTKPTKPTEPPKKCDPPKESHPTPQQPITDNRGVGNGNNGNGNGQGNVGNGNNNSGNAGRDVNVGPGGANGNNNHTQTGNQTNQQGVGNVNGDGNSVNINTPHSDKKTHKFFGLQ